MDRSGPATAKCINLYRRIRSFLGYLEFQTETLPDILVGESLITPEQLSEALEEQRKNGGRLGSCLVGRGLISEEHLTAVLSKQYGVPCINLSCVEVDPDVAGLLSPDLANKYQVLPLSRMGSTLTIAMVDPTNVIALDELRFITGMNIQPLVAPESQMKEAVKKQFGASYDSRLKSAFDDLTTADANSVEVIAIEEEEEDLLSLERESGEAPVVRLVNLVFLDAVKRGASDIHFEPYEREFRLRFRIDGILETTMNPPIKLRDVITSRIKIMANLDISEKRVPQDGRIRVRLRVDDRLKELDFRVSTLPTLFGEKIVMRLLDRDNLMFDMRRLGLEAESLKRLDRAIKKPFGMVLVTGPTGSGKTNTLYSAIAQLNKPDVNIMTAEDPVEFNLPGINQVQMKEQVGLNFATALRSFLRQDPNIILVGEIRDFETAEIAVKAALTGHMVLSTLHTNDAPGTISRLLNMGIEPFLLATSLHAVCAQRLVRRVCTACREEVDTPQQLLVDLGFSDEEAQEVKPVHGAGCSKCLGSGYKGRIGLYEVMEMSDNLRGTVSSGGSSIELHKKAVAEGMITLRRSGLIKIKEQLTSVEEVIRETVS